MRQIIYSLAFDQAVARLGGYILVDEALDPIIDGLSRNPYGFPAKAYSVASGVIKIL